jgi:hypothetical protein
MFCKPYDTLLDSADSYNNRHKCKDQTKIESCNIVAGGPCSVIAECAASSTCIDIPNHWGVACKKSIPSTDGEASSASSSITPAKRDVSADGRKCTKTRRGVCTGINDFCAVRPGDWCKDNQSCHDDCTCCRKPRVAKSISEVREDASTTLPCATNETSQTKRSPNEEVEVSGATGVCKSGDYWCYPVGANYLLICDDQGRWQISADCGTRFGYGW